MASTIFKKMSTVIKKFVRYLEGRVGNTERLCDSTTLIIQPFEKAVRL